MDTHSDILDRTSCCVLSVHFNSSECEGSSPRPNLVNTALVAAVTSARRMDEHLKYRKIKTDNPQKRKDGIQNQAQSNEFTFNSHRDQNKVYISVDLVQNTLKNSFEIEKNKKQKRKQKGSFKGKTTKNIHVDIIGSSINRRKSILNSNYLRSRSQRKIIKFDQALLILVNPTKKQNKAKALI